MLLSFQSFQGQLDEDVVFQNSCRLFRMRSTKTWTKKGGNKCMLQLKKDSLSSRLQIIAWDSSVKTIVLNADTTDLVEPHAHTSSSNTAVLKLYDNSPHKFNQTFAFIF